MPRHIALISEHASPLSALGGVDSGGQNVYVAQVGRHLARLGYRVDIFTRRDDATLPTIVSLENRLRVIHVEAGPASYIAKEDMLAYMPAFADWMLDFILGQGGYELLHANFFMSGLVAKRLKEQLGIPYAVTFHALGLVRLMHQGGVDRFPRERPRIEAEVMTTADAIIAECPQDEFDQIHLYGADPGKMHIVPCGFSNEELWPVPKQVARQRLSLDPDRWLAVHIGRMVPRKGVDTAIEGFAKLVKHHGKSADMLVVGGESDTPDTRLTPEIGRLMDIAQQEQVADLVTFTGRRSRQVLRDYYSAADVFITTPWYEPFGITPVEAMACGTPVIGTRVGGIQYTVQHCRTGLLVPPGDSDAVGDALAALYERPRLVDRMSAAAIRRANRLFTWQRVASEMAGVFERVLARPAAPLAAHSATRSLRTA